MFPNPTDSTGGLAGLPGRPDFSDPRFMFMGSCRNTPFPAIFEHATLHAHSDKKGSVGAVDVAIMPSDSIMYPDGQKAQPLALLIGEGVLHGAWSGRTPAGSELILADWLLPYFLADSNHPRGFGQETYYYAFAASPNSGHMRPAKKLTGFLLDLTRLVGEVSEDARRGQPSHPIYRDIRPPPIVTYIGCKNGDGDTPPADPGAAPANDMDREFLKFNAEMVGSCRPFYPNEAAANAGISTAMARFLLRRMAARGEVASSEQIGAANRF